MSRAQTPEEIRDMFLNSVRLAVSEWKGYSNKNLEEKLNGLAFSILCIIDGVAEFPCSLDLVCRPHPDDKDYYIRLDLNWIEDGMTINGEEYLHELWHQDVEEKF